MVFWDVIDIIVAVLIAVLIPAILRHHIKNVQEKLLLWFHKDYNRDLEDEHKLITQKNNELLKYRTQNKFSITFYLLFTLLSLLLFFIFILPVVTITDGASDIVQTKLYPALELNTDDSLFIYGSVTTALFSILFTFLFGLYLAWFVFILFGQIWPRLRDYAVLIITPDGTRYANTRKKIEHLVRLKHFHLEKVSTEKELIRILFNGRNQTVIWSLIISGLLTIIFIFLDSYAFTHIADNKITHRPYFSKSVKVYTIPDIENLNRRCKIFLQRGKLNANFRYEIVMKDGHKISIISGTNPTHKTILSAYKIHENIDIEPKPTQYFAGKGRKSKANYTTCKDMLIGNYSRTPSFIIKKLLQ